MAQCHGESSTTHLTITVLPGSHVSTMQIHLCSASLRRMLRESSRRTFSQQRLAICETYVLASDLYFLEAVGAVGHGTSWRTACHWCTRSACRRAETTARLLDHALDNVEMFPIYVNISLAIYVNISLRSSNGDMHALVDNIAPTPFPSFSEALCVRRDRGWQARPYSCMLF